MSVCLSLYLFEYSYVLISLSESALGDVECKEKFCHILLHPLNTHTHTHTHAHAHLGYARYSTFDQLAGRNQIALKKILESDEDSNVSAVMKVKDLYRSCVNTGAINAEGAMPLMELINSTGKETRRRKEGINVVECERPSLRRRRGGTYCRCGRMEEARM